MTPHPHGGFPLNPQPRQVITNIDARQSIENLHLNEPDTLARDLAICESALPGQGGQFMMEMIREQSAHRRRMEEGQLEISKKEADDNGKLAHRGQTFGMALLAFTILCAAVVALAKPDAVIVGLFLSVTVVSGVLGLAGLGVGRKPELPQPAPTASEPERTNHPASSE